MAEVVINEGDEWTDGWFAYIAYRKADGTMVVRDVEGFDYPLDEFKSMLSSSTSADLAPVTDIEANERIARWEGEVGALPR